MSGIEIGKMLKTEEPFILNDEILIKYEDRYETLVRILNLFRKSKEDLKKVQLAFSIKDQEGVDKIILAPKIVSLQLEQDLLYVRATSEAFLVTMTGIICTGTVLIDDDNVVLKSIGYSFQTEWKLGEIVFAQVSFHVRD